VRRSLFATALVLAWGCGLGVVGTATTDKPGDGGAPESSTSTAPPLPPPQPPPPGDAANDVELDADADARTIIHAQTDLQFTAASTQYVDFTSIPIPPDFTVQAWVKPASMGQEMMIVSEDRILNTDDQFRLALLDTGRLYFAMSDGNSNYYGLMDYGEPVAQQFALHSPSPLPVGAWSHVAVTKSGAAFALLVNAVTVSTFTASSGTFTRNGGTWNFRIAARMGNGGPTNYFDGAIDEVRLYTRARSAAEIASDMGTELVPSSPGYPDLASYWRFDEGAGTTVGDDLKRYDGTTKNGPVWTPSDAF
jgi:hypothetical protein